VFYPYPLLVYVDLLSLAHICGLGLGHFSALVCKLAVKNGGVQLEIILDLPFGFPINNIISLGVYPVQGHPGK